MVAKIKEGSFAEQADIREQDVLLEVNGIDFLRKDLSPEKKHEIMR